MSIRKVRDTYSVDLFNPYIPATVVITLTAGCLDSAETDTENKGNRHSDGLTGLIERNQDHTTGLPESYFEEVLDSQRPPIVSLCCSDSRVSQEGMWNVHNPGVVFAPSNIGNVVWDTYDGEEVVDGSVHYPIAYTETDTAVIVGHSQCGAIQAAYNAVTTGELPPESGISKRVELLLPVVEAGLASGEIYPSNSNAVVINQLVEYNVNQQVAFLLNSDAISDTVDCYGFVYDFHGHFGDVNGRTYLLTSSPP